MTGVHVTERDARAPTTLKCLLFSLDSQVVLGLQHIIQLEHVGVLDELENCDFPLHLHPQLRFLWKTEHVWWFQATVS